MSASGISTDNLLWPSFSGPSQLAAVERTPLSERGLPASSYELVRRAAGLWPDRLAASVLPDAERFRAPVVRTFAELAGDVHRAAAVLAGLGCSGVTRWRSSRLIARSCCRCCLLLAAEAVGIYAPINPGLAPEHAIALLRLSGAGVIVASGPGGGVGARAGDRGEHGRARVVGAAPDGSARTSVYA